MELQHYEMESERLRFRRLRADDFSLVAPILQDAETMYAWEHGFSYEEVVDWIADMLRRYHEDGCGYFAGLDRDRSQNVSTRRPLQSGSAILCGVKYGDKAMALNALAHHLNLHSKN